MGKFRFEPNDAGIQEMLKSDGMQSVLKEYASDAVQSAGPGYASDVHVFQKRAVAHVFPETAEARNDNYENNTLLKVVNAG